MSPSEVLPSEIDPDTDPDPTDSEDTETVLTVLDGGQRYCPLELLLSSWACIILPASEGSWRRKGILATFESIRGYGLEAKRGYGLGGMRV
jgi:hypothetical protein